MRIDPMSTMTSQSASGASSQTTLIRLGIALEVSTVYAGILLYIWQWQLTYPRAWMALLALVLASHVAHRDSLHDLGLTLLELRASAQAVLPLATALFVPVAIYGLASGKLFPLAPGVKTIASFAGYGLWCVFQQYLTQSFFHNRLMRLASNHHVSSLFVALMFGAAHIPNPILMVATTLGGFILAEVFARHRNVYPLALAQTVGGFLIAALSPTSLIHNMRVGPGYFLFGLR
jgi:hypothetical protein